MTLEELRKEVFTAMQSKKPSWYRKGQFVFTMSTLSTALLEQFNSMMELTAST